MFKKKIKKNDDQMNTSMNTFVSEIILLFNATDDQSLRCEDGSDECHAGVKPKLLIHSMIQLLYVGMYQFLSACLENGTVDRGYLL